MNSPPPPKNTLGPFPKFYSFFFLFTFFFFFPSHRRHFFFFLLLLFGSLSFLSSTRLVACKRFPCIFSIKTAKRTLGAFRLCTFRTEAARGRCLAQFESNELGNSPHLPSPGIFAVLCCAVLCQYHTTCIITSAMAIKG